MTQSDRNWLFNESYRLDNLNRLWLPAKVRDGIRVIAPVELERLRIREKTKDLCVVFTETELCKLAEDLRELAANDESRVLHDRKRVNR